MPAVQSGYFRLAAPVAWGLLWALGFGLVAGCTTQASINGTYEHFYVSNRTASFNDGYELASLKRLAQCNEPIYPDKPFTISLNHVFLRYLQSFDGEILVYSEATMPERPDVLKPQRRLLAYKRGQGHRTDIGFIDPVVYGPAPAPHYPLSVRLIVAELDKDDNENLANLVKTAAAAVATAQPESGPAAGMVAQLGNYLLQMNTDDLEFDVTYTFYPSSGDRATAFPAERNKAPGSSDDCENDGTRYLVLTLAEQTIITIKTELPSRHLPPEEFGEGFANLLTWPVWIFFPGYVFARPPNEDSMNRNEDTPSLVYWDGHYLRFRHSGSESSDYPAWPKQNPLILNLLFFIPRALLVPHWQSPWWPDKESDKVLYRRLQLDQEIKVLEEEYRKLERDQLQFKKNQSELLQSRDKHQAPDSSLLSSKGDKETTRPPVSTSDSLPENPDLVWIRGEVELLQEGINHTETRRRETFQRTKELEAQRTSIGEDLTSCNLQIEQTSHQPVDEQTSTTLRNLTGRKEQLERSSEKTARKIAFQEDLARAMEAELQWKGDIIENAKEWERAALERQRLSRKQAEQQRLESDEMKAKQKKMLSELYDKRSEIAAIDQQRGFLVAQQRKMSKSAGRVRAHGKYQAKTYAAVTVARAPESIPAENYQAILDSSRDYLNQTLTSAADQKLARDVLLSSTTDLFVAIEEERRNTEERLQQADAIFLEDREVSAIVPEGDQQMACLATQGRSVAKLFVQAHREAATSSLAHLADKTSSKEEAIRTAQWRIQRQATSFFTSRLGFRVSWAQIEQFANDPPEPLFGWDPETQSFIPPKYVVKESNAH